LSLLAILILHMLLCRLNNVLSSFVILGHLHLGNIFIEDGNVRLGDIENFILGLPPYYRTFLTYHRKCNVRVLAAMNCKTREYTEL